MSEKINRQETRRGMPLLLSIILVFIMFGTVVFSVSRRISGEMSASAVQNLRESLDLIESTIEAILRSQVEFQTLIAREIAGAEDPEAYIRAYEGNRTMSGLALIRAGETEGVSNTGAVFSEEGLNFSAGGTVMGLPVSRSYLNDMGTWAYTIKCPVELDGRTVGTLYAEYIYTALDRSLPDGFYNRQATLYIMDGKSRRFVLQPKGMGQRSAGHLNLEDFYRANDLKDPEILSQADACLENGQNYLFYHDVRSVQSLSYMWSVNDGTLYLVGYVPVHAIQQEGRSVTWSILTVVISMLAAFFLCILLYYLNWRQQDQLRREQEEERSLHSRQLTEALRAAQIASESKTTFLSNMSHDIRTPMNAVLGFAALLAKDAENPAKVREYTRKIMASGQHLLSLINDILDVSKIESGKVALSLDAFTFSGMISSVEAMIQPMAKARGQTFRLEVTGIRHECLMGDETRINQVLINLLSNAVKYTPEGGCIWFRIIGLPQRSSQYEHIRIEVEDNGYGMTPEYLETIFDAFTRAENSTTNKVQGTGLGMAITKSLVELMGGTIAVQSEVGRGSLFQVDLELRIGEEQDSRRFWERQGVSCLLAAGGDPESRENIRALMEPTGVVPETAGSPEEAAAWLRSGGDCQLALADWETCGLQGVRTLRKALPPGVPLLLLAEFDAGDTEEALALNRTALLTKPFFVSALQERAAELWAEPGGAEEAGDLRGLHFLAAEDNEINAEILSELMELEGVSCEIVENGLLAVECFRQSEPGTYDAILLDVQMPVMNGHEAARAIRALERPDAGRIPIIAMTANAFTEDERAALDAGMDAHAAKPLDMELLKKLIHQLIKRKEASDP